MHAAWYAWIEVLQAFAQSNVADIETTTPAPATR